VNGTRRGRVIVGADDPEFPGRWYTGPDGRAGWVPAELVRREGQEGVMLRDYAAREVSVEVGLEVAVHQVVSGWAWVSVADGRAGWLSQSCLGTE
jgi:hypothetical protein